MNSAVVLIGLGLTITLINFPLSGFESPKLHGQQAQATKQTLYLVEDENERWCGYSTETAWRSAAEKVQDHMPVAVIEYERSNISRVEVIFSGEDHATTDDYAFAAEEPNRLIRTTRNLPENFDDEQTWQIQANKAVLQQRKIRTLDLQPLKDTSVAGEATDDDIVLHTPDFEFFAFVRDRKAEIFSRGSACNPLRPGQIPKPPLTEPKGSILLTVAEGGAVYLDWEKVIDLAPAETYELKDLKSTLHQLRIEKSGALPIYRLVLVPRDQAISLSLKFTDFIPAPQKMEFIHVDPGEFEMGCDPIRPPCFESDKAHHVRITQSFEIAKYVVTQAQWKEAMSGNPSYIVGPTLPIDNVSWVDAQQFLQRLNAKGDGYRYRLPTEAEWEYAARTVPSVFFAATVDGTVGELPRAHDYNSARDGSDERIEEVQEFVQDWFDDNYYKLSPAADPKGPPNGAYRVVRSGSWQYASAYGKVWGRGHTNPMDNAINLSFRCVREPLK
jgi:formylglycine-generating enzyme required for sulfatase activity